MKLSFWHLGKKTTAAKKWTSVDWSRMLHLIINLVLPFALLGLIWADLVPIAVIVVLLSKWRVFAVRINHLPANLRANLTDFIVQFSTLAFMVAASEGTAAQIALACWYVLWLIFIKPGRGMVWVTVQTILAQLIGTTALMTFSLNLHELLLLGGIWVIIYATTYHFLTSFEEPRSRLYGKLWALLGTELAWVLSHWNLRYFSVTSQFTLVMAVASYVAAQLYIAGRDNSVKSKQEVKILLVIATLLFVLMVIRANWNGQIE